MKNARSKFQANKYTVIASCDAVYYDKYAPALIMSAIKTKTPVHIHVVNPTSVQCHEMEEISKRTAFFTFSWEFEDFPGASEIQKRVYYASARYRIADEYLSMMGGLPEHDPTTGILILDIDSIIKRPYEDWSWATKSLGIWDRRSENLGNNDIERRGMKVIACMYCAMDAIGVLEDIYEKIAREKFRYWFLDQIAVHDSWQEAVAVGVEWFDLKDKGIIDWEFRDDSWFWTGKGDRKFTNQKYVNEATRLSNEFKEWRRQ